MALLAALACAGCGPATDRPTVDYYLPNPRALARVSRAVMLELAYEGPHPDLARDMTEAAVRAIRDRRLFHVELVRGDDPRMLELPVRIEGRKTLQDLAALRKAFRCDAIILGSIRRYEPYPRMQIALCLQLLDLRRGRLIWGLEQTWDTTDRVTESRIREFFRKGMRENYGPLDWRLATVSPKVFQKYVAWEVSETFVADAPPARTGTRVDLRTIGESLRKMQRIAKKLQVVG